MSKDESRSERDTMIAEIAKATHEQCRIQWPEMHIVPWDEITEGTRQIAVIRAALALDAAIDAAAKVTRESNSDGRCPHSEQIVAAILALKGDRNVEQSGTD